MSRGMNTDTSQHASMHELAASYALNALDPAESQQFEEHLKQGCSACEAELDAFSRVAGAIGMSAQASPPAHLRNELRARLKKSPQVPGLLLEESGLLISRSGELSWQTMSPGIVYKTLYEDTKRKYSTSLVRMESGVRYPSHRHAGIEELFVLSGDLHVEGQIMRMGDYCRAASGAIHGEAYTESGCVFMLLASQENELLTAQTYEQLPY